MYLLFGDHPKALIHIEIQNVVYVLLLIFLFLKIDSELQFPFLHFLSNLDHKFLFM
jgi:hypothetical protein